MIMPKVYPDFSNISENFGMYDRPNQEICTRTSWVDAERAYKQIKKGKAVGNSCALVLRAWLQGYLFRLGCAIQRHPIKTLFVGVLVLAVCCVGLKTAKIETDIQRLWVEEGGRLSKEIEYTRSVLGEDSGAFNELILVQTPRRGGSATDVESLLLHQQTLQAATEITIDMFDIQWKLKDICYASSFPSYEDNLFDRLLGNLMPCVIISPLDCFWEGSKALGPENPVYIGLGGYDFVKWTNLDPFQLVLSIAESMEYDIITDAVLGIMDRGGVDKGYQDKPCLNPNDPECPHTAPNYESKEAPDVGSVLTGGCRGFASNYMHWEEDLILGGITRNQSGHIVRGEALQSIIQLMGVHELFELYKDDLKVQAVNWTPQNAQLILQAWQRKYTEVVSSMVNATGRDDLHPFSSISLLDMLTEFSQINVMRVGIGYGLMLLYACVSLIRRTSAVGSQAGVGFMGVCLVALSVASALGLCSVIGSSFNAATTQIIPFLALGLGIDDMFLVAHSFTEISKNQNIPLKEQTGTCLKRVGISVLLTSASNACAFFMASIIPIPALRAFSFQAGVVVLFNLFTILIVFSAVVSLDLIRRDSRRVDIFCCFKGGSSTDHSENELELQSVSSSSTSSLSKRSTSPPPPYTSQQHLTSSRTQVHQLETRVQKDGSRVTVIAKGPPIYEGSDMSLNNYSAQSHSPESQNKHCVCKVWSLSKFAKRFYGPQLMKNSHKVVVLVMFAILFGVGVFGTFQVQDGLDLRDVVPKGTKAHDYLDVQAKYFGFYNMYAVTKNDFDYANGQQLLYDFHNSFNEVDLVIKKENGTLPKFWLPMFRDWLLEIQNSLQLDIAEGCIHRDGWHDNATGDGVLGYKLIIQTGDSGKNIDKDRVLSGHLVDEEGIIYPPAFYNYLTAWTSNDALAYAASEANFVPNPNEWYYVDDDYDFMIPKSPRLQYTQLPFHLHHMVDTAKVTETIRQIRDLCEEFQAKGLPNFPSGIPFTYWEQYLNLRFYLYLSLGCVLLSIFVVLAVSLMNAWIAIVVVFLLALMVVELFGLMGLLGIKLSAIPAVILIVSVGVGVEFTVHVSLGFLTAVGNRNLRAVISLEHTMAPVVHGGISTLIGIVMLAGAEFDFVFKYFFLELFGLIILGLLHGLLLLPVLLSLIGPKGEVRSLHGEHFLPPPSPESSPPSSPRISRRKPVKTKTIKFNKRMYQRAHKDSLSTISEEPTQYSSQDAVVCRPELTVETVPQVSKYYDCSDGYSSPGQVTHVKTTATLKLEVHTPIHDAKKPPKPRRKRTRTTAVPSTSSQSDSDCNSDQTGEDRPRPRLHRPRKPHCHPLKCEPSLQCDHFNDSHHQSGYSLRSAPETYRCSVESLPKRYATISKKSASLLKLQTLTSDSESDMEIKQRFTNSTDYLSSSSAINNSKQSKNVSQKQSTNMDNNHLQNKHSHPQTTYSTHSVPSVFTTENSRTSCKQTKENSTASSKHTQQNPTPLCRITRENSTPANQNPPRYKKIEVRPYRDPQDLTDFFDVDSDLSSSSSSSDLTDDENDRRVLEACDFSDTEASLV